MSAPIVVLVNKIPIYVTTVYDIDISDNSVVDNKMISANMTAGDAYASIFTHISASYAKSVFDRLKIVVIDDENVAVDLDGAIIVKYVITKGLLNTDVTKSTDDYLLIS
jgi:hypothetical protein